MGNGNEINSKQYWDERFGSGDWEDKKGREQSTFFYKLALDNFPKWLENEIDKDVLSICDLGCAEGEGVFELGKKFRGSKISGIDISEEGIKKAKSYYPDYEFIAEDIGKLDRKFDVVFTSNTLEHFSDPNSFIKTILTKTERYFIMLLPFREFNRIDEHFYTFDYNSFPINNEEFSLVYFKEIDCRYLDNTQWIGEEILLIYQKKDSKNYGSRTLENLSCGRFDECLKLKNQGGHTGELFSEYVGELSKRESEISKLKAKIEEDRNAIMQIQFEAAQHKQAELDARETYIWKTGVKIEAILKKTGIAFIRSLLDISDFKRVGLWLTLRKGFNEAFNRVDSRKNKKLHYRLCRDKFLDYKRSRNETACVDITAFDCPSEKGKVSVVLPVYNGGNVISEAIESILNQSYKNFELIIVNDGSTDNTAEIIESYRKKDSRIKVISQENLKIPTALSNGFRIASGEFYTWTSADNIMLENCIEVLVKNLNNKPDVSMVYGNIRLINAKGKIKRGQFWFEKPLFSGNVILPKSTDVLNTHANNTIGAAFMYRAKAAYILEDYSKYKHTLEDYDYWMRMNSLLKIEHIDEDEPIYLYRWHEDSLTAHDKELGITKNRYKLMVLDDFRRDFYMSSLIWVAESEDKDNEYFRAFKKSAEQAGHIFMTAKEALSMSLPTVSPNLCYIYFGNNIEKSCVNDMQRFSGTVLVSDNTSHIDKEKAELFDAVISTEKNSELKSLSDFKGVLYTEDKENLFALIDSKMKNRILYSLEGRIETDTNYEKKISIIICTYLRGEKLIDALWSVIRQSFSKKEYEIIIVDNAPNESGIEDEINLFAKKYSQFEGFIKYIAVPQKGLSYARNAGMWEASGEYLLFIDDDALADYYLLEELYSGFKYHPNVGVLGGQIILDIPFPRPEVLKPGWESLWSQFKVSDTSFKEVTQQFEFPYGANYAVRRSAIRRVGGFRMCYGRTGKDFAGGEETALAFKMRQIGYSVGIQPRAKVLHRVDNDRFTKEHVKKTIRAGILTTYRFFKDLHTPVGWSERYIKNQIKITKGELRRFIRHKVSQVEIFHKSSNLAAWQEMLEIVRKDKKKQL